MSIDVGHLSDNPCRLGRARAWIRYEMVKIFRRRCSGQRPRHAPDWVTLVPLLGWGLVYWGLRGKLLQKGLVSRAEGPKCERDRTQRRTASIPPAIKASWFF